MHIDRKTTTVLGHRFACRHCRKQFSLLKGSFFEKMKIPIKNVIYLLFLWSRLTPARIAADLLNMVKKNSSTTLSLLSRYS